MQIYDLLALVAASGGRIARRGRLQRTAYLLQWARLPVFGGCQFRSGTHGPYSRELSDVLHHNINAGHLSEFIELDKSHSYELSAQAAELCVDLRVRPELLKYLATSLNRKPWEARDLAASALFFQAEEGTETPLWNLATTLGKGPLTALGKAKKAVETLSYLKDKVPVWSDLWCLKLGDLQKIPRLD